MPNPVDQLLTIMKANGQLMLKLAEITRTSGEEYAKIGSKAASKLADQAKAAAPGKVPAFEGEGAAEILSEIGRCRDESLEQVKSVFNEWRGAWTKAISDTGGQQGLTEAMQSMLQPLLRFGAASEPKEAGTPIGPAEPAPLAPGKFGSEA